ncbi:MAG: hypothetical protein RMX96_08090 [Nostoc sp. ChiSLP02]|nr:hypothetical protein [Nostoc sp. DedSLP05]MDZ8102609.1 hypothetical protein [Nostoc sp. DedSLP01]MDZ8184795.1 hypothetical protein [Nostoc sp. ChiSLP02]
MGRLNNSWDNYCVRYLAALGTDLADETLKNLWSETRQHFLSASEEDINWFIQALEDEQRKLFVVFMANKVTKSAPKHLKEVLFYPLIRAAIYERNPSLNRSFVEPCVIAFGHRLVNEALLEFVEHGSNFEKAGAINALYWAQVPLRFDGKVPSFSKEYATPESQAAYDALADIHLRKRCLFLTEFVKNYSVEVSRSIIPSLILDPLLYPDELKHLIPKAIAIAKTHTDSYISHRIEVQLGTESLLQPLPLRDSNHQT